jgi:hypothetical protein
VFTTNKSNEEEMRGILFVNFVKYIDVCHPIFVRNGMGNSITIQAAMKQTFRITN